MGSLIIILTVSKEALVGIEILRAALAGTDMPIRMLRPEPSRGQGPAVRLLRCAHARDL